METVLWAGSWGKGGEQGGGRREERTSAFPRSLLSGRDSAGHRGQRGEPCLVRRGVSRPLWREAKSGKVPRGQGTDRGRWSLWIQQFK